MSKTNKFCIQVNSHEQPIVGRLLSDRKSTIDLRYHMIPVGGFCSMFIVTTKSYASMRLWLMKHNVNGVVIPHSEPTIDHVVEAAVALFADAESLIQRGNSILAPHVQDAVKSGDLPRIDELIAKLPVCQQRDVLQVSRKYTKLCSEKAKTEV